MLTHYLFGADATAWLVLESVICGAIVIVAGSRLSRAADAISEVTGLGHAWLGVALLAVVTSMPELVTTIGAVTLDPPEPDLLFGNVFGSNVANVALIVIMDLFAGRGPMTSRVRSSQALLAAMGMMLTALAALVLAAASFKPALIESYGWIASLGIVAAYLAMIRIVFVTETAADDVDKSPSSRDAARGGPLRSAIIQTAIASGVVIATGLWLVRLADELAERELHVAGVTIVLGSSFVGVLLLATATSLPELAVSFAAVRRGNVDMAMGNVFGSNMFNMLIIPIGGAFFRDGSIYAAASPMHLITAFLAIILMGIAISGITIRSRRSFLRMGWDSITILIVYLAGMAMLFYVR